LGSVWIQNEESGKAGLLPVAEGLEPGGCSL
jgi:hypothetical protein